MLALVHGLGKERGTAVMLLNGMGSVVKHEINLCVQTPIELKNGVGLENLDNNNDHFSHPPAFHLDPTHSL